jgi:hypothetical protein
VSDCSGWLRGVVFICLAAACASPARTRSARLVAASETPDCVAPISGVPDGWLWMPTRVVDSAPGAYHDKISGAFVSYDGLDRDGILAQSHRKEHPLRVSGHRGTTPYELEVIPDIREHLIDQGRRRWGSEFPEGTIAADTLPLAGARRLKLRFVTHSAEWWFTSDVYSKTQEKRVRQLLLGPTSGLCEHLVASESEGQGLGPDVLKALVPGTPAQQVLQIPNVLPYVAYPVGRVGFRLFYSTEDGNIRLHFDQDQALVTIVPEK